MSLFRPYAEQHAVLSGPGDQRPTAEQAVRDQNLVGGLAGTNILITGCSSGIEFGAKRQTGCKGNCPPQVPPPGGGTTFERDSALPPPSGRG
ncbi:uncharacterized protein LTR77_008702 [Saxophila tyrrhenica]|uniref:Uncharacterized protein n=1 Tax=Saxophila tyrrhenica TaxID=1690608 RepID=A0AAV9P432_9PEZI|nr:hypothetical protein LTR77_008702 [Saxophila tyrrhenica]